MQEVDLAHWSVNLECYCGIWGRPQTTEPYLQNSGETTLFHFPSLLSRQETLSHAKKNTLLPRPRSGFPWGSKRAQMGWVVPIRVQIYTAPQRTRWMCVCLHVYFHFCAQHLSPVWRWRIQPGPGHKNILIMEKLNDSMLYFNILHQTFHS